MRNPIRSETDAFHLALGGAGLTGAALLIGASFGAIAGGALFAAGLVGAVAWELSRDDPDRRRPLREAAAEGRRAPSPTRWRVLVVANRTLAGAELATKLRRRTVATRMCRRRSKRCAARGEAPRARRDQA